MAQMYFFSAVLWGCIAATIYHRKGRPVIYGFVVGFFLGVLGLLYAWSRSPRQDKIEAHQLQKGQMKKCPRCGELVRPEATVCRYCQTPL